MTLVVPVKDSYLSDSRQVTDSTNVGVTLVEVLFAVQPPLAGIRILALEQAVALPVGTRHLADLGADVVRVQSHQRARGQAGPAAANLLRSKRLLAIDLESPAGPELFRRLASVCDVVAHNFTPRVVEKFGINYSAIRNVNPDVIYLSLTGFGMTGPWGPRPLFGPGAEAVSGHNNLIGDPEQWLGRPGTIVYADNITGMNAAFAILAALDHRDRTGEGQHIDLSLYEAMVSHLGPVLAESSLGAAPARFGNSDQNWALHAVFDAEGRDRHIAIVATEDQLDAVARALDITEYSVQALATAIRGLDAESVVDRLQSTGVAATVVADASDLATDQQLWQRGYWSLMTSDGDQYPYVGPPWGGGSFTPTWEPAVVGTENATILTEFLDLTEDEIRSYEEQGAIGTGPQLPQPRFADAATRIERGELSRIDKQHDGWRAQLSQAGVERGGFSDRPTYSATSPRSSEEAG